MELNIRMFAAPFRMGVNHGEVDDREISLD